MTVRVAINGFGRIGRLVLRAIIENNRKDIEVVAINDLGPVDHNAHLLKYDSIHGTLKNEVTNNESELIIDGKSIKALAEPDPAKLPWADLNIDIALECSGRFTNKESASKHLTAGAKKVLISAPADGVDLTVVFGVNHDQLKAEHKVVSNASCTTNCLAPIAKILDENIGIENGYMTTIHSYTSDQRLVDTLHSDLRRARAAALSMIPTSTGAAKAVGLVLPQLKGKLDGCAIRVPTPNVSVVDLTFNSAKATSIEEINQLIKKAASNEMKNILETNIAPLVSIDFNHNPHSSIFDLTQTHVIDGRLCRVLSWYDNEWGFANRMSDVAVHMGKL